MQKLVKKKCKRCGITFECFPNRVYCDTCNIARNRERNHDYYHRVGQAKARERNERKRAEKERKKNSLSIAEFDREAAGAGLSYGHYEAMNEMKKGRYIWKRQNLNSTNHS